MMSQVPIQWPPFLKSSIFGDCFHRKCVDCWHKQKKLIFCIFQMKTDTSGWAKMIQTGYMWTEEFLKMVIKNFCIFIQKQICVDGALVFNLNKFWLHGVSHLFNISNALSLSLGFSRIFSSKTWQRKHTSLLPFNGPWNFQLVHKATHSVFFMGKKF